MRYKPAFIDLRDIDTEDTGLKITTRSSIDDILPSITDYGILNPPILKKTKEKLKIVSGFRRISACFHAEKKEIEARIIESNIGILETVKIAILDNSMQRSLNLVEESRALILLSGCTDNEMGLAETSALLGLPDNIPLINKIKRISCLPENVQSAIAEGFISLAMAIELDCIEAEAAIFFTRLFKDLKTGLNKQREILTTSLEIACREEIKVMDVLNDKCFIELINDPDTDRTQKSHSVRQYLKTRRFPEIIKAEKKFKSRLKTLNLGKDIKLIHPKSFEGEYFSLNFQFKDLIELKKQGEILNGLTQNSVMKHILLKQ